MGQYTLRHVVGSLVFGLCLALIWQHYPTLLAALDSTLPLTPGKARTSMQWSMPRAVNSYMRYEEEAGWEPAKMKNTYAKIGLARRHIGKQLGYPAKLDKLRDTVRVNAMVTSGIARHAREKYGIRAKVNGTEGSDLSRVREAMKHFIRDWSLEGRNERATIFQPILERLSQVHLSDRKAMSVLVPGSGLGRLAWEISQLGFNTTANELSPYMFLALQYLLSPDYTSVVDQHTLHPYSHWFSHQVSSENLFRSVTFPDVVPHLSESFNLLEGDFIDLLPDPDQSYKAIVGWANDPPDTSNTRAEPSRSKSYDFIVTLFFIDTSPNIITTLSQTYNLLKPNGIWINLGPLLWTSGAQTVMELSLDELLHAIKMTGFVLEVIDEGADGEVAQTSRVIECEYTADQRAMMKWIYQARYWVATKAADIPSE